MLEELKQVVQDWQGRTDSMIFILNRVDQRGTDDIPISERIDKLQKEIQEVLSLEVPPEILPFNARLLYYAQCAWGSVPLAQASSVDQTVRLKLLDAMFQDCAGAIRQHIGDNRELRRWFRYVEDQVCDGENISDETTRKLLQYALDWSGGDKLWNRLRTRVQESFSELILLPALVEVFANYDALAKAIDTVASIRKIEQKEEIEIQQARINESRQRLHEAVEDTREKFRARMKTTIEIIKENDQEVRSRLTQQLQKEGLHGFQLLHDAVGEVEGDLIQVLIAPVRDALKNNQGAYELEENLSKVITPAVANSIAREYDQASREIGNFTPASEYLVKRVRKDDKKEIKKLENAERAVRKLYQAMREALSVRAEFKLQSQAQKIEDALEQLVREQENELCVLCLQKLPTLMLDRAIVTDFKKNLSSNLIVLPEKFFDITATIKQNESEKKEVVDKKEVTKTYTEGSCFNKKEYERTEYEDVIGDVQYRELALPNINMMTRQWAEGVTKGKSGLWDILYNWIAARLDWASCVFNQSVDEAIELAERALQEQLQIIKENSATEMRRWSKIEAQKALGTEICKKLEDQLHNICTSKKDDIS